MINLSQKIDNDLEILEKRIKQAAEERDESATPMESASDQTRQIANQLYNSLLEERKKLQELRHLIPKESRTVTIRNLRDNTLRNYFIVPNGLGGAKIDDVFLLSNESLLAQKIIEKKRGFEFDLNGVMFRIEEA